MEELILPSDASRETHPNNSIGQYTVRLPVPLELGEKEVWEVALTELYYPDRWHIQPEDGQRLFALQAPNLVPDNEWGRPLLHQWAVPATATGREGLHHLVVSLPHYLPLKRGLRRLEELTLKVLDELERPVVFTGGKCVAALSLRRRRRRRR